MTRIVLIVVVIAALAAGAIFLAPGLFAGSSPAPAAGKAAVVSSAWRDVGASAPLQSVAAARSLNAAPASAPAAPLQGMAFEQLRNAAPARAAAELAHLSADRSPAALPAAPVVAAASGQAAADLAYLSAGRGTAALPAAPALAAAPAEAAADLAYLSAGRGSAALPAAPVVAAASGQAAADLAYLGAGRGSAASPAAPAVAAAPAEAAADLAYLSAGRGTAALPSAPALAAAPAESAADLAYLSAGRGTVASNAAPALVQHRRLTAISGSEQRFFGPPASVWAVNGWTQVRGVPLKGNFAFSGPSVTLQGFESQVTHATLDANNNGYTWGEVTYTDAATGLTCKGSVTGKITDALATLSIAAPCENGAMLVGTMQDMSTDPPNVAPPKSVISNFSGMLLEPD